MKKKMAKKGLALLLTGATLVLGSLSVSAADWTAIHVNMQGAPMNASTTAYVTIYHGVHGALVRCTSASHSNPAGTTGKEYVECTSHPMVVDNNSYLTIVSTGSGVCTPNIGSPLRDIPVSYKISAATPVINDIYETRGNIVKNE